MPGPATGQAARPTAASSVRAGHPVSRDGIRGQLRAHLVLVRTVSPGLPDMIVLTVFWGFEDPTDGHTYFRDFPLGQRPLCPGLIVLTVVMPAPSIRCLFGARNPRIENRLDGRLGKVPQTLTQAEQTGQNLRPDPTCLLSSHHSCRSHPGRSPGNMDGPIF